MTTNEARRASDCGYLAMTRNEKNPMCDTDFVDLIADILICAELDYGCDASELVESALEQVRGELDGDEFTTEMKDCGCRSCYATTVGLTEEAIDNWGGPIKCRLTTTDGDEFTSGVTA
jgi:hypothetical protein